MRHAHPLALTKGPRLRSLRLRGQPLAASSMSEPPSPAADSASAAAAPISAPLPPPPCRTLVCADALTWLAALPDAGMGPGRSVFTSLPDISEMPTLFPASLAPTARASAYSAWFVAAVALLLGKLSTGCYAVFLQSDVRVQDPTSKQHLLWLDKAALCSQAAQQVPGCTLTWHKIVMTTDPEKRCFARPSYSHLLCFSKGATYAAEAWGTADVFDRGPMLWPKGIGLHCALTGTAFLRDVAGAAEVVDPFCGFGTVLAVANVLGMDALGVDISAGRCIKAATTDVYEALHQLGVQGRSKLGLSKGCTPRREFTAVLHGTGLGPGRQQAQGPSNGVTASEGNEACMLQHGSLRDGMEPGQRHTSGSGLSASGEEEHTGIRAEPQGPGLGPGRQQAQAPSNGVTAKASEGNEACTLQHESLQNGMEPGRRRTCGGGVTAPGEGEEEEQQCTGLREVTGGIKGVGLRRQHAPAHAAGPGSALEAQAGACSQIDCPDVAAQPGVQLGP